MSEDYYIWGIEPPIYAPMFKKVKGEAVVIPGFKWMHLFTHRTEHTWRVSEATTGCYVSFAGTKEEAIEMATDVLKGCGRKLIKEKIKERLETAVSPWVPPKRAKEQEKSTKTREG